MKLFSKFLLLSSLTILFLTNSFSAGFKLSFTEDQKIDVTQKGLNAVIFPKYQTESTAIKQWKSQQEAALQIQLEAVKALNATYQQSVANLLTAIEALEAQEPDCKERLERYNDEFCVPCVEKKCKARAEDCRTDLEKLILLAKQIYDVTIGKVFSEVTDFFKEDVAKFGEDVLSGLKDIGGEIEDFGKDVGKFGQKSLQGLGKVGKDIGKGLEDISRNIGKGFEKGVSNVGKGFEKGVSSVGKGFEKGVSSVGKGFEKGLKNIGGGIGKVTSGIKKEVGKVTSGISKGIGKVTSGISNGIGKVTSGISKGIGKVTSGISKGLSGISRGISRSFGRFGKRSVAIVRSAEHRQYFLSRRRRAEANCDELREDPEKACLAYVEDCPCDPESQISTLCPNYQAALDAAFAAEKAVNESVDAYIAAAEAFDASLQSYNEEYVRRLRNFCWGLDLYRHYTSDLTQNTPWWTISELSLTLAPVDGAIRATVESHITVGSPDNRFSGPLVITPAENPTEPTGNEDLSLETVEWFQKQLVANNRCDFD